MKTGTISGICLALALTFSGCKVMSLDDVHPIPMPETLTRQDAKLALLSAVYPDKAPREWTPIEMMTDNALRAFFGFNYQPVKRRGTWFVEDLRSDSVVLGVDNGKHYLRLLYTIGDRELMPKIDGSRNLNQSKTTIHSAAREWIGEMESRIRQSMGNISVMKAQYLEKQGSTSQ